MLQLATINSPNPKQDLALLSICPLTLSIELIILVFLTVLELAVALILIVFTHLGNKSRLTKYMLMIEETQALSH